MATRRTWTPSIVLLAFTAFGSWRTRPRLISRRTKAGRWAALPTAGDLLLLWQQGDHVRRGWCRDHLGSSACPARADAARSGRRPPRRYYFPVTGYNFRLTNVACAILCAQLERRKSIVHREAGDLPRPIARARRRAPGIGSSPSRNGRSRRPGSSASRSTRTPTGARARSSARSRPRKDRDTALLHPTEHTPAIPRARGRKYDLGVTDRLGESGMNLPTYADLAETDLDRIADVIGSASR